MIEVPEKSKSDRSSLQKQRLAQDQKPAVNALQSALAPFSVSPNEAVAIWIGLKSKPGIVFYNEERDDLNNIAIGIAETILDKDQQRWILLQGHPWWAEPSRNQAQLIGMQQRLTSMRLRSFLIEAAQKQRKDLVHFALLREVSRAELVTLFVNIPKQVKFLGGVLELPWKLTNLAANVPENVYIIATLGQDLEIIDDQRVLNNCVVIYLANHHSDLMAPPELSDVFQGSAGQILSSCRSFDPRHARSLLPTGQTHSSLQVLNEVLNLLRKHDIQPDPGLIKDALLYIGHAWDQKGQGLYDEHLEANIEIASDFWLFQSVIPRIWLKAKQNKWLQQDGIQLLAGRYPMSEQKWKSLFQS
jgi:hypothetical protein